MGADTWPDGPLKGDAMDRLRDSLERHPVSFAMVFGSVAREETTSESDVDIAVEFEGVRPEDDGYSDVYLGLCSDLDEALPAESDVVDVRSLSPSFARVVFDDGVLILGSDERRAELEREVAGDRPTVSDARDRIAAAARRMREDSDADRGKS